MKMKEGKMDKLRIGLVGMWGRGQLALWANRPEEGIRVVAGADPSPEAAEKFKGRLGAEIPVYQSHVEMFEKEKLDAVFICSPDFCHEEQACDALSRGISVYLEKPMALSPDGCDRILRTSLKSGAKIFLGHNMRYMSFVQKMKELIDSDAIGQVKAVWCRHFISYGGDAYFRDWHSERKNAVSMLLQKGAHDIDVIHWLAGSYTDTVTGMGGLTLYDACPRRSPSEKGISKFDASHWPPLEQSGFSPVIDIEDQNMILMRLENGVFCSYLQCHFTPDSCRNYTVIGTKGRIENYGDSGEELSIDLWNKRRDHFRLHGDETIKIPMEAGGHGGSDEKIVKGFLDYLLLGKKPFTSPVASRYSVATGYCGAESIRNGGQAVRVPKLPKELENAV